VPPSTSSGAQLPPRSGIHRTLPDLVSSKDRLLTIYVDSVSLMAITVGVIEVINVQKCQRIN